MGPFHCNSKSLSTSVASMYPSLYFCRTFFSLLGKTLQKYYNGCKILVVGHFLIFQIDQKLFFTFYRLEIKTISHFLIGHEPDICIINGRHLILGERTIFQALIAPILIISGSYERHHVIFLDGRCIG